MCCLEWSTSPRSSVLLIVPAGLLSSRTDGDEWPESLVSFWRRSLLRRLDSIYFGFCVIEHLPGRWQTSKTYRKILFLYFCWMEEKSELLIEILVPTQIVCWSQEKSRSSSHKYFLLQIFGNFKRINSSIGLLENCLANLLIFYGIHLWTWKEIFNYGFIMRKKAKQNYINWIYLKLEISRRWFIMKSPSWFWKMFINKRLK